MTGDLPPIPDGWRLTQLATLCQRVTVGYVSSTRAFFCPPGEGIRLIRSQNIRPGRLIFDDAAWVKREFHDANPKSQLKPGDILVTRVGANAGDVCIVPDGVGELHCSSAVFARPISSHRKYLELFCRSPLGQRLLKSRIVGSVSERINTRDVESLPVLLPPAIEEEAIAGILGGLDDKIELNRRVNETLEAMARAIFKSWFVHFDPVRAKSAGRQPFGMDAETAALFPSSFEDSLLGKIPKGWKPGKLDQLVSIHSGGTPKTSIPAYWNGDIPWFSVVDAPRSSDVFVIHTEKNITRAGVNNSAAEILPAGTTIISARGTVGKLAVMGVPMATNQSCYALRGRADFGDYFTYFHLQSKVEELTQSTHGTVFDTITRQTFGIIDSAIPPSQLTKSFDGLVRPLMQRILTNLLESRTLGSIRDALLPRLISGEIRIKDAE